jgi:hypothetical protein
MADYHHMIATSVAVFSQYLAGAAPPLKNPRFLARMFVGGLLGFVISQQIFPGTLLPVLSSEEIAREVVRQFLTGIPWAALPGRLKEGNSLVLILVH